MPAQDITEIKAAFWRNHERFLKNTLVTEQPHPLTHNLSQLAETDIAAAINLILQIDISVIEKLKTYSLELEQLHSAISQTVQSGHKVFIAGCGASGRLAASLEYCWRRKFPAQASQVISVIAGGDAALIRSIERCEDHADYGIKQLHQQGFTANDLLISTTAGGESPFILGATQYAAEHSKRQPWLLYCNPNETLLARNSTHPICDPRVNGWYIETGPMALTGSTRMQTTTAMLLGIGLALLYQKSEIFKALNQLLDQVKSIDLSVIKPLIEAESACYQHNQKMLYLTEPQYALGILADTTERSPTFNLLPFENQHDQSIKQSWCYLGIIGSHNSAQAWQALVNRSLVSLNWPELPETSEKHLQGFDLSEDYAKQRHALNILKISSNNHGIELALSGKQPYQCNLALADLDLFQQQIILKLTLNILSTLVMGRLGFYQGNLMTSLYPSNHKLIDRAIRYVSFRYNQETGKTLSYENIAEAVFSELPNLQPNESIVEKTLIRLRS
jgi:N-acetylmuramic acid 6-phosphate etherase